MSDATPVPPLPRDRDPALVSVVTPMLNERAVLHDFHHRLSSALDGLEWELVVVDDGSTDGTGAMLDALSAEDPHVSVVHFTRNFGHQAALSAGMDFARGDVVVTIDADLQDPPELIAAMVARWREGYDFVRGVRGTRAGEARWRLTAIKAFYRLLGRIAHVDISANAGDFRLLDRRAVDVLRTMPERNRYLRGLATWLGFAATDVLYDRDERFAGETKYPLRKLVSLALNAVTSFSKFPLRMASYLGLAFATLAFLALPLTVIARITGLIYVPGQSSVIITVCFLGGVQLLTLGVIGEYLGRMYDEIKRRPLYVVRTHVVGGKPQDLAPGLVDRAAL